jgi:hypothetical protein
LWESWFLPNARYLGLLVAAFELTVAVRILSRGRVTRVGFVGTLVFHIALAGIFGMWPYTIPMIAALGYMLRFDFPSGPFARFRAQLTSS